MFDVAGDRVVTGRVEQSLKERVVRSAVFYDNCVVQTSFNFPEKGTADEEQSVQVGPVRYMA